MGRASQKRPKRLAEKLLAVRNSMNLSQNELIDWLDSKGELTQAEISAFERDVRIPSLLVLLRYARKAKINLEILIDDNLDIRDKHKS